MKTFKEKIKKYSFWTGLSAAVIMLLTALGKCFGFSIDNKIVEDIIMSICSVLVALGIVCVPKKENTSQTTKTSQLKTEEDDSIEKE